MKKPQHFDVLIVGGGMVGCTLASLLCENDASAHLRIAVIEAEESEPKISAEAFDARVVALSNMSVQILESAGVWREISAQRLCAYREMYVWDGEGTADIRFGCHDIREQQLGYIIENSVILKALREKLSTASQITFFKPARVKDVLLGSTEDKLQGVSVELEGEVEGLRLCRCRLGGRSRLGLHNGGRRRRLFGCRLRAPRGRLRPLRLQASRAAPRAATSSSAGWCCPGCRG